ncbi:hypothetical protein JB92DRAFT_2922549, partial [Gautieria morchelliformis]
MELVALPSFTRGLSELPTMSDIDPNLLHFSGFSKSRPASEAKLRHSNASPPLKWTIDPEDLRLAMITHPSQPLPAWSRPRHRRRNTYYLTDPIIVGDADTPYTFEG